MAKVKAHSLVPYRLCRHGVIKIPILPTWHTLVRVCVREWLLLSFLILSLSSHPHSLPLPLSHSSLPFPLSSLPPSALGNQLGRFMLVFNLPLSLPSSQPSAISWVVSCSCSIATRRSTSKPWAGSSSVSAKLAPGVVSTNSTDSRRECSQPSPNRFRSGFLCNLERANQRPNVGLVMYVPDLRLYKN